jgi:hypothetical protein
LTRNQVPAGDCAHVEDNIDFTAQALLAEEQMHASAIASRCRRSLAVEHMQSSVHSTVSRKSNTSTLPWVPSTKRPTIKELMRHPSNLSTPSTKMPEDADWHDDLAMTGDEDRQSLADEILRFFEQQEEVCLHG